jgi:MFS transporter, DHA2 family, multidrug resistance protein
MSGSALPNVAAVGSSPQSIAGRSGQTGYMLLGLGLATWMEFYTYDGVNLVLPDMAGTFGLSQDQASWILTVYLSSLLFGVPVSIWMAAHVGYLRYILGSIILFAVASVGCAMAPDFGTFLALRALQGFAGAGLIMWWRASVYMLFVGPQRSSSLLRISVMLYLATSVGLLFCGYVTDTDGWRLIFLPNVVFAAVSIRLLVRHFPKVPRPADNRAASIDKCGILLLGITLISLQIALSRGDIDDWFGSPRIQLLAWIAAISLILFVAWQLSPRNPAPLLHLQLVRDRNMQAAIFIGLLAGVILSGSIYAMPEYLRTVFPQPLSAAQTGRIMCAYSLTAALLRVFVTPAIARFGQRKTITFAFCMLIASMLLAARLMTTATPDYYYMIPLVLYAFCLAPMLSAIGSGTVSKLPNAQQLDAVAIYMTFRQFGASLGITLITTLLDWRETLHSSRLFSAVQASGAQTQDWLRTIAQTIVERGGVSAFQAQQMAVQMLDNVSSRQAMTLAYADAFRAMAAIGLVALCFVLLMSPSPVMKKK